MKRSRAAQILAIAVLATGCAQPGTQASRSQAARLDVATRRMSAACGYASELTAFSGPRPPELRAVEAMAAKGALQLASVYAGDPNDLYQGESIGAIVKDSIALLGDCGLERARAVLVRALKR